MASTSPIAERLTSTTTTRVGCQGNRLRVRQTSFCIPSNPEFQTECHVEVLRIRSNPNPQGSPPTNPAFKNLM